MNAEFNYDFASASMFSINYQSELETLSQDSLKSIAAMFIRHMNRVGSLGTLPMHFAAMSYLFGQLYVQAHAKFKLQAKRDNFQVEPRVRTEIEYNFREYMARALADQDYGTRITSTGDHLVRQTSFLAGSVTEHGIEATLSAMVVEAWGAFETTAKELWIVAVNQRPKSLAKNILLSKIPNKFLDGTIEKTSGAENPTIELRRLVEYGFDLREDMADLLIKSRKVNFETFNNLKSAYEAAFGREPIDKIMNIDYSLHTISLVRNLFAHRGGLVDERFLEQTQSSKPFGALEVGSIARLNGSMVRLYIEGIISCSVGLVTYVDEWLRENRE